MAQTNKDALKVPMATEPEKDASPEDKAAWKVMTGGASKYDLTPYSKKISTQSYKPAAKKVAPKKTNKKVITTKQ